MKVPLSWLRDYVDVGLPAQELAHRLTMAGVEVGDVAEVGNWSQCLVAQVMAVGPHPQADRLSLCRVYTGSEEVEVVCGAPNVEASQKVCFARVGAKLINPQTGKHETLKPARIRGVVSEGMICSQLELGLGEDHTGIIVLPDDAPVGTTLDDYMGDTILDLELTPNRLDCLSILGVAHEVAALTGNTVKEPDASYAEEGPPLAQRISIGIEDPDLCRRYTASLISDVAIGPSPQWLQDRLTKAGLRPINNVVDVTNYVMLEYNQPLHAFDYDRLQGQTIIVRRAKAGETLTTLDGVERRLDSDVLVIADSNDPIGMGGVIGGANSEIGPVTTNVLLESATFDGYNNRQTAQKFGLRTEATLRFEKGLRAELAPIALRRATQLIQETAGGRVSPGICDVFPNQQSLPQSVALTAGRLKKVLGMEVDLETVERVLRSLGFQTRMQGSDRVEAAVPYWRNDITIEDDLVEEVIRIIGYDSIPVTMLATPIPTQQRGENRRLVDKVKDALSSLGMQEVINYPLISQEDLMRVQWDEPTGPVRVANPMNAAEECLRPTLKPSLLATLAANQGQGAASFRLFEIGRVFMPRLDDLPEEREMAAGILSGQRWLPSWLEAERQGGGALDFYDAKGVVESLLEQLGTTAGYEPGGHPYFRAGRQAVIKLGDQVIGTVGEVHESVLAKFDLVGEPVAYFELDLNTLLPALSQSERRFSHISRYPVATRDLALVLPVTVPAATVQSIIARHRLVERVELFDLYTGDNVPPGAKSLAFRVYFQASDRTLTNEEVDRSLQGLLAALEREAQASLRS